MVKVVNDRAVLQAIRQRSTHIKENASTLSMKGLRALLEQDLKLPAQTLKPFKKFIEEKTLKMLENKAEGEEEEQEAPQDSDEENRPREKKKKKRKPDKPAGKSAEKHEKPAKKSKSSSKDKPAKKTKRESSEPDAEEDTKPHKAAGGKAHSSKVLHLQFVCKRATIKIPPNTYRGDPSEQELAGRLEALLDKYGLSKKSGEREITKTKSRLQTERELEGIDTSNIMEGGRRARRAAAPAIDYKTLQGSSDSDDSPEPGSESGGGSEGEAEPSDAGRKTKRRKSESSASDEAGPDESADEAEQECSGQQSAEEPAAAAQEKPSPRKRRTVLDDSSDDEEAGGPLEQRQKAASPALPHAQAKPESEGAAEAAADVSMTPHGDAEAELDTVTVSDPQASDAQQQRAAADQDEQPAAQHNSDHSAEPDDVAAEKDGSVSEPELPTEARAPVPARRRAVLEESSDEE